MGVKTVCIENPIARFFYTPVFECCAIVLYLSLFIDDECRYFNIQSAIQIHIYTDLQ